MFTAKSSLYKGLLLQNIYLEIWALVEEGWEHWSGLIFTHNKSDCGE